MGVLPSTISMVSFANVDEPWSPWMLTKTGAALQDLFTKTSLACLHAVFDSNKLSSMIRLLQKLLTSRYCSELNLFHQYQ